MPPHIYRKTSLSKERHGNFGPPIFFIDQRAMCGRGQPQVFNFVGFESLEEPCHILQNGQVTSNKMVHKKGTSFWQSFPYPFTWCALFFARVSFKNH